MTVQDLTSFLVNAQNMSEVTDDLCQSIIERFEPSEEGKSKLLLSLDGEYNYYIYMHVHVHTCNASIN